MNLVALPAFSDNYIWMLHDGRQALVVDPGDAAPVLAALDAQQLALTAILVTHHHPDHVGGLAGLHARLEGVVHGPERERGRIPGPLVGHGDGDTIEWNGLRLEAMDVPGHTAGHLAWFAPGLVPQPALFCGDTLFSAGCGRLFEGSAEQMLASLERLAALPGDTLVCCAHEYTLGNLRFAQAVEPGNPAVSQHQRLCEALRASQQATLPSRIDLERQINPFLRCDQAEVVASAQAQGAADGTPVEVFRALRDWKNGFR